MKRAPIWIVFVLLLAGAAVAFWWIRLRPPQNATALLEVLPPGAEAYALLDLQILQSNPAVRRLLAEPPPASLTQDYQQFLEQTGFRYQNHLRQLAAAKFGADWVGVAVVEMDRARWEGYMESQGAVRSEFEGKTIYSFGSERPFRLMILDNHRVAFAIGPELSLLQAILRQAGQPNKGSAAAELTREGLMPPNSEASGLWIIARADRFGETNAAGPSVGPFQFGMEWWQGSRLILARIVSNPVRLEAEIESRCQDVASAQRMARGFEAMLAILRALPPPPSDSEVPDYSPILAAISIRQQETSVFIRWKWDPSMLPLLAGG